ncbi:GMC family oxidoreductase [Polaribacter uvawellassae]|uniref:GMC family oxidoreductase n=1 Tax=Polaribacter uvawellassae TaxID=3133495 RepID=UPI00321933A5
MEYDYIIIGSGFGGSVSALRLSEKGYKVLVIEKGKWYQAADFPKTNWDIKRWLWLPFIKCFGIMKLSFFRHITIASGVGVGGGSLVYANTLPIPKSPFFNSGSWSELNNWEEDLKPHYQTALKMLGATITPQLFDGDKALQKVAKKLSKEAQFSPTNVAVYFGKPNVSHPDPYFEGKGPERVGCIFCGACMTGCPNNSKNTLDKNYLYFAQKNGVKIMAEKEVFDIKPTKSSDGSDGYEVYIKNSTSFFKKKQKISTKGIIVSGGVIGTIKLLLKLKKTSLPRFSDRLGQDIRTNNETLISVSTLDDTLNLSKGVAIGSILHTDENSHLEIVRYGEGSNAWKFLHVPYSVSKNHLIRYLNIFWNFLKTPLAYFKIYVKNSWAKKTVVLLFMQTLDSTLVFKNSIFGGMKTNVGFGKKPTPFIPESIALTSQYAKEINGKPTTFIGEALLGIPSTAHVLGGAVMGKDSSTGVIDKNNKVFGYENMYIIDGSMISANPGVNPSLSITAIAERAMSKIQPKSVL